MLGIKPRAQQMLGRHLPTRLNPQLPMWVLKLNTEAITLFKVSFSLTMPYSSMNSFLFPQSVPVSRSSEWSCGSIEGQWWRDHFCEWPNSSRSNTILISHEPILNWHLPKPSVYILSAGWPSPSNILSILSCLVVIEWQTDVRIPPKPN